MIASAVRGSANEADQGYFSRLADVAPRSGLIFDAALALASNPSARPEARVGAMQILAKQLVGNGGGLNVMGGMKGLEGPNPFCRVGVAIVAPGAGDTTAVQDDPLPAGYRERIKSSMEAIALIPSTDLTVRNAARCVRGHFKPAMIEPLDPSTIQIGSVCGTRFRIRNTGTRSVVLTFDIAGRPGRSKYVAPVGHSFLWAEYPGIVRLYYADREIGSAPSSKEACPVAR